MTENDQSDIIRNLLETGDCQTIDTCVERDGNPGFTCTCPFHEDTQPSFAVNAVTGLWICFGCGKSGNLPMLAAQILGIPLDQAISKFERFKPWPKLPVNREAVGVDPVLPESTLLPFMLEYSRYMKDERGFSVKFLKEFEIGYAASDGRVVFPIRNSSGGLVGLTTRATLEGQTPKYKHTRFQKSRHLYLFHRIAADFPRGHVLVLTEGHVDALRLWQLFGKVTGCLAQKMPNNLLFGGACAAMGSSLSDHQVTLIAHSDVKDVVLAFDNDDAGERMTEGAYMALLKAGVRSLYLMTFPGKDPGALVDADEVGITKV